MKKIKITSAALLIAATASQASIVGFGERYVDGAAGSGTLFSDNPTIDYAAEWTSTPGTSADLGSSHAVSVTDTDNDITFTITLSSDGNNIGYRDTREDVGLLDDGSGYTGAADSTIEDGEGTLTMSLSLSGSGVADLTSLSLERIYGRRWADDEGAILGDGSTTATFLGAIDYLDYNGDLGAIGQTMTTLTALTKDNVNTWALTLTPGSGASIGLGAIGFDYTVPEPATLSMVAIASGLLFLIRRRIKI